MATSGYLVDGVCYSSLVESCYSYNSKPGFGVGNYFLTPIGSQSFHGTSCLISYKTTSIIDGSVGTPITYTQTPTVCNVSNTIELGNDYLTVVGMCIIFAVGFTTGNRR